MIEVDPIQNLERVYLQTISTCPANCVFCPYAESWHKSNPGKMKLSLFRTILDQLEDFKNFKTLCPYLMNEPLTDNRLPDLIWNFYNKYPDKRVELSVNPYSLTHDMSDRLIDVLSDRDHLINISFNGTNQASFEYVMQIPFKVSFNNLIYFLENSVDHELNITITGSGKSVKDSRKFFYKSEYANFWRQVINDYRLRAHFDITIRDFDDRAGNLRRDDRGAKDFNLNIRRDLEDSYCTMYDKVLCVLWNGDVAACVMDYRHEVKLSNLNNVTIVDHYSSEEYRDFVGQATGYDPSPIDFICRRCGYPSTLEEK